MKQIFTLAILMIASSSFSQVVINEIYPEPGSGRSEFFELYNTSTSSVNSSVDGFTLVTYFEEGSKKGFYVLDLADLTIAPKGYFVGASAKPFNFQTTNNSNAANFSWNDPNLSANYGYLAKWILANDNDASDGNRDYNLAPIPSNFNDFFYKMSGGSAAYNVLVFKNGILINAFFGNLSSSTFPLFISAMPNLKVSQVTSSADPYNFLVNFNSIKNKAFENVSSSIGTDNGYIRTHDGSCGSWAKSSSGVTHTPGVTNGPASNSIGDVNISAYIIRGTLLNSTSSLVYSLVSATSNVFPLVIDEYIDNGTVPGELDATDTYLRTDNFLTFTTNQVLSSFSPKEANMLLVVKTAAGCYDQVKSVQNSQAITLPLTIISFSGVRKNDFVALQWTVGDNELLDKVYLEKNDGGTFSDLAVIMGTDKKGEEYYAYNDRNVSDKNVSYRLRIFHKSGKIEYSKTIKIGDALQFGLDASVIGNPVLGAFKIRINTPDSRNSYQIKVFDQAGRVMLSKYVLSVKGENIVMVPESDKLNKGFYYVEITQDQFKRILKVVKQ